MDFQTFTFNSILYASEMYSIFSFVVVVMVRKVSIFR